MVGRAEGKTRVGNLGSILWSAPLYEPSGLGFSSFRKHLMGRAAASSNPLSSWRMPEPFGALGEGEIARATVDREDQEPTIHMNGHGLDILQSMIEAAE